MWLLNSTGQH